MSTAVNGSVADAPAAARDPLYDAAIIPDLLAKIGAMTVRGEILQGQAQQIAAQHHAALTELERRDRALDALAARLERDPGELREMWSEVLTETE